jgi:hypothetical protein
MLVYLPATCFTAVWSMHEEGMMTVQFDHEKLDAYQAALEMIAWLGATPR